MQKRACVPSRDHRGFTLVELMVALVVSAILVGIVFEFLLGQGRFARLEAGREETQQNARVAVDVISSDLRALGPGGIVPATATANSITFRAPRAWGVVCGISNGSLAVMFPAAALPVLRTGADSLAVGTDFYNAQDRTGTRVAEAATFCNTAIAPNPLANGAAAAAEARARLYELVPTPPAYLARQGAYVYDKVTYDVGSSAVPGIWIRRNSQPLAGPVPTSGGLVLTYFKRSSGRQITPATEPTELDSVGRIQIRVRTIPRGASNEAQQDDIDSTVVYLRNRDQLCPGVNC